MTAPDRSTRISNWTITIEYGSPKRRSRGHYEAIGVTKDDAIINALRFFVRRNRTNPQVTYVQEWQVSRQQELDEAYRYAAGGGHGQPDG